MRRSDRRTCEPVHSAICKKYHGAARCGVHRSAVPLVYSINELRLYLFSTRKTTAQHAHRSGGRRLDLASLDRSRAYLLSRQSRPDGRASSASRRTARTPTRLCAGEACVYVCGVWWVAKRSHRHPFHIENVADCALSEGVSEQAEGWRRARASTTSRSSTRAPPKPGCRGRKARRAARPRSARRAQALAGHHPLASAARGEAAARSRARRRRLAGYPPRAHCPPLAWRHPPPLRPG